MDAQAVLVDCWRLVEKHGRTPTIKGTMRMAREVGAHFDEKWARRLLRPFVSKKSTPLAPRSNPDDTPQLELQHPDVTPPAPTSKRGSRAHSKVLLVPKEIASQSYAVPAKAAKEPRVDSRTEAEIAADQALSLLRPRIAPLLVSTTWTTWKRRNRQVLVDMVRAGMTPAEIERAHDMVRARDGEPFVIMAWFQRALETARGSPQDRRESSSAPPGYETPAPLFGIPRRPRSPTESPPVEVNA